MTSYLFIYLSIYPFSSFHIGLPSLSLSLTVYVEREIFAGYEEGAGIKETLKEMLEVRETSHL